MVLFKNNVWGRHCVQWVKLPPGVPTFHMGVLAQVPAMLLLIQLPANTSGNMTAHAPVPDTHVGGQDEGPGSRLQTGPTVAVAVMWQVNQQTQDLFL